MHTGFRSKPLLLLAAVSGMLPMFVPSPLSADAHTKREWVHDFLTTNQTSFDSSPETYSDAHASWYPLDVISGASPIDTDTELQPSPCEPWQTEIGDIYKKLSDNRAIIDGLIEDTVYLIADNFSLEELKELSKLGLNDQVSGQCGSYPSNVNKRVCTLQSAGLLHLKKSRETARYKQFETKSSVLWILHASDLVVGARKIFEERYPNGNRCISAYKESTETLHKYRPLYEPYLYGFTSTPK